MGVFGVGFGENVRLVGSLDEVDVYFEIVDCNGCE